MTPPGNPRSPCWLPVGNLRRRLPAFLFCVIYFSVFAAAQPKLSFNLPAESAAVSLKRFADQSGLEVVFSTQATSGIRTNAVRGEFTAREAVERLLAGTGLVAEQNSRTGAVTVLTDPNGARAAPASGAAPDRVVEMSPFVISEESETGWVATESLAGTRLRTNIRDLPNQIETLTREFMNDLALTNLDQAMSYTANVENLNDFGTQASLNDTKTPNRAGRIRGIGIGTRSRNFFQITNPTDNFNLERVTVASGPNAILFGLGSPAGIFDSTPARALPRNRYGFEVQFDSENSERSTVDLNAMVVPQKLSLRLMGLYKREHTSKKPNHDHDDRLYGTVTFTPFKNTSINLQGEKANRSWNRPSRNPPSDFLSAWYRADRISGSGHAVPMPAFDNRSLAGIANNALFTQAGEGPVFIHGGSVAPRSWRNSVTVKGPGQLPGGDPLFDRRTQFSVPPEIFPRDANLFGTGRESRYAADTKTVIVEQRIAHDFFLELAYNYENANNKDGAAGSAAAGSGYDLQVDANLFIPGTSTPNPNFGRMYRQGGTASGVGLNRREDWRVTLSYEADLAQKLQGRSRWAGWFGRHRFAGLYTGSTAESKNQENFARRILDDPAITGVTLRPRTFQNWATHATRVPLFRQYLDDPYGVVAAGPLFGDWSLTDASGRPYSLYLYDTPLTAAGGKRLGAGGIPFGSHNRNAAQIFAWQGFFLPSREKLDRLVLTFGYRRDRVKSATLDAASTRQDFSGLYPIIWDTRFDEFGPAQSGTNRNLGVIARPIRWLSVFYNHSSTFDLNTGQYDPYGNEIPGAGGKGKDYGIRLDLWGDKLGLRINRYENTIGPVASGGAARGPGPLTTLELRVRELDPTLPTISVADGNLRGLPVAGLSNYRVTGDSRSTGTEVELNFTPVQNWNIRVNGSVSKSVESNIGLPWMAWTAERLPIWQSVVAKNGEVDTSGRPVTWRSAPLSALAPTGDTLEQYYNATIVGDVFARMQAEEGTPAASARNRRANLITNYRFREGRLKGFNLGGAARWLAAPVIGLGVTTTPTGQRILDVNQKYLGKDELYFDAVVGYRGRLKALGGINYRVQLNIRNLLDERDPIPTQALSTGQVMRVATIEPRVFVGTFSVDY